MEAKSGLALNIFLITLNIFELERQSNREGNAL
jgi:hypothetical protein